MVGVLAASLALWGSACGGGGGGATGAGGGAGAAGAPVAMPDLVRPDRHGFEHDLFVVTDGRPGHSFRVRMGAGRPPQVLAASLPAFYDGEALALFGRLVLRRDIDVGEGAVLRDRRVRLWETDGLGTGRWIHDHGLFGADPEEMFCEEPPCSFERSAGTDLVTIVGDLRGVRRWTWNQLGGDRGLAQVEYEIVDRFGRVQKMIDLYPGEEHRALIRLAYDEWYRYDEQRRACYKFDYKSSLLRPVPGGLAWVMHGRAMYPQCQGSSLPVEVPADPPRFGVRDPSRWGPPGERFVFGDGLVEVDPVTPLVVRTAAHAVTLPGGGGENPPLAAIAWLREDAIPPAHLEPLDLAFSEVHPLPWIEGGNPAVDGLLDEWSEMLLLDARTNVCWVRAGERWDGAADASLAAALHHGPRGWTVAARVVDDVVRAAPIPEGRPAARDHLELWLEVPEGRLQVAVLPEPGEPAARIEAWGLAPEGEQAEPVPPAQATVTEGMKAAWRLRPAAGDLAAGWDAEVFIPEGILRLVDGRPDLSVLVADGDGGSDLEGDLLLGTAPPLVAVRAGPGPDGG